MAAAHTPSLDNLDAARREFDAATTISGELRAADRLSRQLDLYLRTQGIDTRRDSVQHGTQADANGHTEASHLAEVREALAAARRAQPPNGMGDRLDMLMALMARVEEYLDHLDAAGPAGDEAREFIRAVAQNSIVADDFTAGNEVFNEVVQAARAAAAELGIAYTPGEGT